MVKLIVIVLAFVSLLFAKRGRGYNYVVLLAAATILITALGAFWDFRAADADKTIQVNEKPGTNLQTSSADELTESSQAYIDGCRYLERQDYQRAAELLARVIPQDKNYYDARIKLGQAQLGFEKEAEPIKKTAEAKLRETQNRQQAKNQADELQKAKISMKEPAFGTGPVGLAVTEIKASTEVVTNLGFKYRKADDLGYYLWLRVLVVNRGSAVVSLQPDDFFISPFDVNSSIPVSEATFSQDHLDKKSLRPNEKYNGWLIFYVPKGSRYILHYYGAVGYANKQVFL